LTDGLQRLDFAPRDAQPTADVTSTLEAIRAEPERGIYLLFDFHALLGYAMGQRMLREIVQRQRSAAHTLVLVGAKVELPDELEALALRVPLAQTRPLSVLMREQVEALRAWVQGRCVAAD